MRTQLSELLKQIAYDAKIIPSYSDPIPADSKTQLLDMLNTLRRQIAYDAELSSLTKPFYIRLLPFYSTGTLAIVHDTVAVTGTLTVITADMIGRKIQIGSDFNVYTVEAFTDATHFNIDRPFAGATETAATYNIYQDTYEAPAELLKIISIVDINKPGRPIWEIKLKDLWLQYADPTKYEGDPLLYAKTQSQRTLETIVNPVTIADDTVTAIGLTGDYDGYYNGWTLFNSTKNIGQRVSSSTYLAGTTTLILDTAVVGGALTDSLVLIKNSWTMIFRWVPDVDDRYLHGVGIVYPPPLVNDYDYDYAIPEMFSDDILKAGVVIQWQKTNGIKDANTFAELKQDFNDLMAQVKSSESQIINRKYQFMRGPSNGLELNPMAGGGWPSDPTIY